MIEIIALVGMITGLVAIVISVSNLFYVRRRTKNTAEQLGILRKDAEKKSNFDQTSRAIRQMIDAIKSIVDWFDFPSLDTLQAEILTYMHDKELERLKVTIQPIKLEIHRIYNEKAEIVNIETPEDLINTIQRWRDSPSLPGASVSFECYPDILSNPFIELTDAFLAVWKLYSACWILEHYDYTIRSFDSKVLEELKKTIDEIAEVIARSSMSEHEISFSKNDRSDTILRRLRNEMVGKASVNELVQRLLAISDQRLDLIQKEAFLRS